MNYRNLEKTAIEAKEAIWSQRYLTKKSRNNYLTMYYMLLESDSLN